MNRLKAIYESDEGVIQNPLYLEDKPIVVGPTRNPCSGFLGFFESSPADAHPTAHGSKAMGLVEHAYQLSEGRIGSKGRDIDRTLNRCTGFQCTGDIPFDLTPWIWSVIKFDAAGEHAPETQIFPTYSIYEDGELQETIPQSDPEAFIALDSESSEKLPSDIQ